jgi:hypothetical protein
MYTLEVSWDCGMGYHKEAEAMDLKEFEPRCKELDDQLVRWVIRKENEEIVGFSAIHQRILGFLDSLTNR